MRKRIKDLTFVELKAICEKYKIYNRMLCEPQCQKDCPLLMKQNKRIVTQFSNYTYTKESCCVNFKESDLSDVERFMNKKVKLEE